MYKRSSTPPRQLRGSFPGGVFVVLHFYADLETQCSGDEPVGYLPLPRPGPQGGGSALPGPTILHSDSSSVS